ncbi:MAG: hypothetical protein HFH41_01510 [Lachnospiraceae bacterium]|nr:hypothetical protein [Lachnospiraceae bacterium]
MIRTGTITRRMDRAFYGLDQEFQSLYDRMDFEKKIEELKGAGGRSNRPGILAGLFEMFEACGIEYEKGGGDDYYEELVHRVKLPSFSDIEDRMLYAVYEKYGDYPSPEEYMNRIVQRLSFPEDHWEQDTLRVRILKQFIKYGDCLDGMKDRNGKKLVGGKNTIKNYIKRKLGRNPKEAEWWELADEGVFLEFESELRKVREEAARLGPEAKKEKKKAREQIKALGKLNGKYGLLKLADDLAAGKFRTEGGTKRYLYWFAMVYGMTYHTGIDHEAGEDQRDIEKNLFQDYYTNNLIRFISDVYKGRLCEYEADPSGQGINYKNFAEVIYLYFIAGDDRPEEKLRRSAEMINRVCSKEDDCRKETEISQGTLYFRSFFGRNPEQELLLCEDVFHLSETEFERFIRENYNCSTYIEEEQEEGVTGRKVGELQIETEQNTAFAVYQSVLQDLQDLEIPLKSCNYGLWFTDLSAFRGRRESGNLAGWTGEEDEKKLEEFWELLAGANRFLEDTLEENASTRKVTRTSLIVAYYYYYNALHENDGRGKWRSFGELFGNFKRGIDEKLEQAYYQPLSGKNLFDVLVVFSSYAYLNL